jgi:hypothetical protein
MLLDDVMRYIESNAKDGKCELPYVMYATLMECAHTHTGMYRPQPPKYNVGGGSSGFFSHKRDSYIYDFNDPIYLAELKKYEAVSKQRQMGGTIHVLTSIGRVEIIPVSGVKSNET